MARVVQKFGGTSVADIDRIQNVAAKVKAEHDRGNEVAVVVSAMAGTTNELVNQTIAIAKLHDVREYDSVVAAGEQISAGLTALALQQLGIDARSWLGWGVELDEPRPGCVVVLKRGNPPSGHVALYESGDGETLQLLGGNQRNQVCVRPYPARRVLSYRWPAQ